MTGYRWLNEQSLEAVLSSITVDEVAEDLLAALALVLDDPEGGASSEVHGTISRPGRRVIPLAHGYFLSYQVYPLGVPPHATPSVKVIWFGQM